MGAFLRGWGLIGGVRARASTWRPEVNSTIDLQIVCFDCDYTYTRTSFTRARGRLAPCIRFAFCSNAKRLCSIYTIYRRRMREFFVCVCVCVYVPGEITLCSSHYIARRVDDGRAMVARQMGARYMLGESTWWNI